MQTNINFVMTEEAGELAISKGMREMSFPSDLGLSSVPQAGDLIAFGAEENPAVFEVIRRLFIWKSPQKLEVQVVIAPAARLPDQS